jgi:hypothetical protein
MEINRDTECFIRRGRSGRNNAHPEYFSLIKKGEAKKKEQPQQRLKGQEDHRTCAL